MDEQLGQSNTGFRTVCTLGLGYIGLPTASLLATKGFQVLGVDVDHRVVDIIGAGEIHFEEPDLDVLVRSAVQSGQLRVAGQPAPADVFILAVPTPFQEGHRPDLSFVKAAVQGIAPEVESGNLVILESTSPVGTTRQVARWLQEARPDLTVAPQGEVNSSSEAVYVAHCPERVLPGNILQELVDNDRLVGGVDQASALHAASFYRSFVNGRVYATDCKTAEMAKLTENAFRDVNIAFANELSLICHRLGIDVWELIELSNHHPRVNILQPGPGVGGHCIAVDPWFIIDSAPAEARLIRTARQVNLAKQRHVVEEVVRLAGCAEAPVISCLGLAYKADVGDLRESPAVGIVSDLLQQDVGRLLVVEPHLDALPASLEHPRCELVDLSTALKRAQICVLLVDHRQFKTITLGALEGMELLDTRGLWRRSGSKWS